MIVNDIINDIIDVCHDGYRYLSNIKCIYVGIIYPYLMSMCWYYMIKYITDTGGGPHKQSLNLRPRFQDPYVIQNSVVIFPWGQIIIEVCQKKSM